MSVVNILDHGAVGDGLTECRPALAAAVAEAVASGRPLWIPPGTYRVTCDDTRKAVRFSGSLDVRGAGPGVSIVDVYPKTLPHTVGLLTNGTAAPGHHFTISGLTVKGPDGPPNAFNEQSVCFSWATGTQFDALFKLEGVEITGLFTNGVSRSGGGQVHVLDSHINAYESPITFFENADTATSPEHALLTVQGCELSSIGGKSTSIGIYIHPHLALCVSKTYFHDFGRYAIYQNGTPEGVCPSALVSDCTLERCWVVQNANGRIQLSNCVHLSYPTTGGTTGNLIAGSASFIGCRFLAQGGAFGLVNDAGGGTLELHGCELRGGQWVVHAPQSGPPNALRLHGCQVYYPAVNPPGALVTQRGANTVTEIDGCLFTFLSSTSSGCLTHRAGAFRLRGCTLTGSPFADTVRVAGTDSDIVLHELEGNLFWHSGPNCVRVTTVVTDVATWSGKFRGGRNLVKGPAAFGVATGNGVLPAAFAEPGYYMHL